MFPKSALVAAVLCLGSSALLAQTPTRIRGTVAALDGDTLRIQPNGGGADRTVVLGPGATVTAVVPATLAAVKPGSFIGTAAQTQAGGSLVAREVHVFPENMRGTGEGHRGFDLGPNSTMTNGTVGQEVVGSSGDTLTVKYGGGEKAIIVPPGTPVVTFEPGTRTELTPGAHVIVFAEAGADGALTSKTVVVGKDGLTPPM